MIIDRKKYPNLLYLSGLLLLVAGLPLSLFLTSLSQFFLAGSFFLEGNFIDKFRRFFRSGTAMLIAGVWLMHVIGLIWTSDLNEGIKDIRIKLPLLVMTVIFAGSEPLSAKQFRWVMGTFIAAVVAGTMVSIGVLTGIVHHPVHDIRDIFIFHISHIRFALFTCIAIFSLAWFYRDETHPLSKSARTGIIVCIAWLFAFLLIAESMTGILILVSTLLIILIYRVLTRGPWRLRLLFLSVILGLPLLLWISILPSLKEAGMRLPYPIDLKARTASGNSYQSDLMNTGYENGYPVHVYVCEPELRSTWNLRSRIPYDSLDERGQMLRATLVRFMASKGLRKDSLGLRTLSDEEIHSIERGITNVKDQHISTIQRRLVQTIWEIDDYFQGGDPSGHSLTQRIEFWRTASGIIAAHPLFGVGTGDLPAAYKAEYERMNSRLSEKFRLRAHNQYLSITAAFGFAGLIFFLFAFFYPVIAEKKYKDYLFITFWIVAMLSMLTEDTLETQPGATFIAFFFALFFFSRPKETPSIS